MSVNAIDLKQGSKSIYSRAHTYGGYNGCTGSTGEYTLWSNNPMFTLKAGNHYRIGFTTGPTYFVGIGLWIDLNQDHDFADSNEWRSEGWCTPLISPGTANLQYFDLYIPESSKKGITRMRIRSTYNSCTQKDNGCKTYSHGETEDFTINIASDSNDAGITYVYKPACDQDIKFVLSNLGNNVLKSFEVGWMVNGSLQTGQKYNTTLYPGTSDTLSLPSSFSFSDNGKYSIKVFSRIPNGNFDNDLSNDTFGLKFEYVSSAKDPFVKDTFRCGTGSVKLRALFSKNNYSLWYGDSLGIKLLSVDSFYNTPKLSKGKYRFYVLSTRLGSDESISTGLFGSFWYGNINSGNMFDVIASKPILLDSVALNINNFNKIQVRIFQKLKSYKGFEKDSTRWTLLKTIKEVNAKGIGKETMISLGPLILPADTSGIYIQVSQGMLFNGGNQLTGNGDLLIKSGSAIRGSFDSATSGYAWSGKIYYRPVLCQTTLKPVTVDVYPTPSGGMLQKHIPFQTKNLTSDGTIEDPDIVKEDDTLSYRLSPPKGFLQTDYGIKWKVLSHSFRTLGGKKVSANSYEFKLPDGINAGSFSVFPKADLEDSLLEIKIVIGDLGSNFCDTSLYRYLYVAPNPKADFNMDSLICLGDSLYLKNVSEISSGNMAFHWNFGTSSPKDTSGKKSPVFLYDKPGKYIISLKARSVKYNYENEIKKDIDVLEYPKVDFETSNSCDGIPLKFRNKTPYYPKVIYKWDFGDPLSNKDTSTATDANWLYLIPAVYQVKLTANNQNCISEITKNVYQFAKPIASFSIKDTLCKYEKTTLENKSTITLGNIGYEWNLGNGNYSFVKEPEYDFKDSGSLKIKLRAISEFGCTDSAEQITYVKENSFADFEWNSACDKTPVNFIFKGNLVPDLKSMVIWNLGINDKDTQLNPIRMYSDTGKYPISLKLNSVNGCSSDVTKILEIKSQATADFELDDVCEGENAVFKNKSQSNSPNIQYLWRFGDGSTSGTVSPEHLYKINGVSKTFNVFLLAKINGGCSDSIIKPINVLAAPDAEFTYTVDDKEVNFKALNQNAASYQWNFGDGGSNSGKETSWTYNEIPVGQYIACLNLTNQEGCSSQSCRYISTPGIVGFPEPSELIKIYPNPATEGIFIQVLTTTEKCSLKLFDLTGKHILELKVQEKNELFYLPLPYKSGIYFLHLSIGEKMFKKMMILGNK